MHWYRGFWVGQCAPDSKIRLSRVLRAARARRVYNILDGSETIDHAITTAVTPLSRDDHSDSEDLTEDDSGPEDELLACSRSTKATGGPMLHRTSSTDTQIASSLANVLTESAKDIAETPYCKDGKVMSDGHPRKMLAVGRGIHGKTIFATIEAPRIMPNGKLMACTRYYSGPANDTTRASYKDIRRWFLGFWAAQLSPNLSIDPLSTPKALRALRVSRIINDLETIEQAIKTRLVVRPADAHGGAQIIAEDIIVGTATSKLNVNVARKEARRSGSIAAPPLPEETLFSQMPRSPSSNICTTQLLNQSNQEPLKSVDTPASRSSSHIPVVKAARATDADVNASKIVRFPYVEAQAAQPASVEARAAPIAQPLPTSINGISTSQQPPPAVAAALFTTPPITVGTTTTMTQDEAFTIFFDGQNAKRKPGQIQEAIAVLTGHTPPLSLIQRACFACLSHKIESIYDFEGYAAWVKDNAVEMLEM